MSIDELCALPVEALAAKDCLLFLWATFPMLPEALQLIRAWGFTFKTVAFVWLKQNRKSPTWFYGLGYWTRGNAEVCLLAKCALPGFVDSKNEEKTERNAGYLVVSHSGGGMLRQGTRKGIRRTPANRGMRAHRIVKSLDISEDVCHGMCP